jgi:hypothetical protein
MKMRSEKILRVRPFNMANFSGAGGYIPVYAILGTIAVFPITLLIWAGLAVPCKNDDGSIDDLALKRKLLRILLPITVLSLIPWFFIVRGETSVYGGSVIAFMVAVALVAIVNFAGVFASIYYSAMILRKTGHLTKGKWFMLTLAFSAVMVIVGIILSLIVVAIAQFISDLHRHPF